MPVRSLTTSTAEVVRKRTAIHQIGIGVCVGRTGGWDETVDRRKILEREQGVRELLDIQGNGREERGQRLHTNSGGDKSRQDS